MSTLTVSIVALVVFVVGAVLLFNLWQARSSRRVARDRFAQPFDAPAAPAGHGPVVRDPRPAAASPADGRHSADHTDWTRQRREPTLVPEEEPLPAMKQYPTRDGVAGRGGAAPEAGDHDEAWYAPGDAPRRANERYEIEKVADVDESRLPDADEDLGPPQFEDPRLDPISMEAPPDARPVGAGQAPSDTPPHVTPHLGPIASEEPAAGSAAGDADADAQEPPYVPATIEHVVTLIPRAPINAERLIALTSSLRHVGSKAVRIEVDSGQGRWVPLHSGVMVGCLRCSVLLANRQGPLNAVELSDFSAAMESLARRIGAAFAAPDMNQVLRQARELDSVAARLDTQVDLGVEASAPITSQKLAAVARQLHLADKGGRFACFADGGDLLFTLGPGATADLLAFVLDVPRTSEEHDPWRSMVACASSCAQLTSGRVVDSAGRGMSVAMIENVGLQIHKRYRELADAGLKAGSPAALRVFN